MVNQVQITYIEGHAITCSACGCHCQRNK